MADGRGRALPGLAAAGLLVAVVGGGLLLRVVDDEEGAWSAYAAAQREQADLESMIGARLEEATGRPGVDGRFSAEDEDLEAQLARLVDRAEDRDDAELAAEALLATEQEVAQDAAEDGAADELLLTDLDSDIRAIERLAVRPLGAEARSTADDARRLALVTVVLATGLWLAVGWLIVARRSALFNQ